MDEFGEWIPLGSFGPPNLESALETNDVSDGTIENVRSWEVRRLQDDREWALVVLSTGEAFERRGTRNHVGFDGFPHAEPEWRILSHTHPLGLPPSVQDILFLLTCRAGIQFRVARKALPAVELWRNGDIVVTHAFAAGAIWTMRNRVWAANGMNLPDELSAEHIWIEIQAGCDKLGISWTQDLERNT